MRVQQIGCLYSEALEIQSFTQIGVLHSAYQSSFALNLEKWKLDLFS